MKKLLLILSIFAYSNSFSQSTASERDSVTNTSDFRTKVKLKSLSAANDLLADNQQPKYVVNYAQIIVTTPSGEGWLTALSYGVMNNPAINWNSSEGDIQFTVNSIFVKYAKAYYRITE